MNTQVQFSDVASTQNTDFPEGQKYDIATFKQYLKACKKTPEAFSPESQNLIQILLDLFKYEKKLIEGVDHAHLLEYPLQKYRQMAFSYLNLLNDNQSKKYDDIKSSVSLKNEKNLKQFNQI